MVYASIVRDEHDGGGFRRVSSFGSPRTTWRIRYLRSTNDIFGVRDQPEMAKTPSEGESWPLTGRHIPDTSDRMEALTFRVSALDCDLVPW